MLKKMLNKEKNFKFDLDKQKITKNIWKLHGTIFLLKNKFYKKILILNQILNYKLKESLL